MTSTIREYITVSRSLGRERHSSTLRELSRLLKFRWQTGSGPSFYTLYGLFDVDRARWPDYLRKDRLTVLQMKVNDSTAFADLDDKQRFADKCKQTGIPTPTVLAVVAATGEASTPPVLSGTLALTRFLNDQGPRDLVFKMLKGTYGYGFWAMRSDGRMLTSLKDGIAYSPDAFLKVLSAVPSRYLVQPRLVPCQELAPVMPGQALGTVRVVTYAQRDGTVVVPWAFIKLPVSGQVSDNFAHGTSGNLVCGIDVTAGSMTHAFGKKRGEQLMTKFTRHPETDAPVMGRGVPRWTEIVSLCIRAAATFPRVRTIGWDVAVTDDGLVVLEGNRTYDPDFMQVTLERGLRADIETLYAS